GRGGRRHRRRPARGAGRRPEPAAGNDRAACGRCRRRCQCRRRCDCRRGDPMKLAQLCLERPIATLLLWLSVIVAGFTCWLRLPVAALPTYDTPTIQVGARLPGASPETMSTSVATPLEK